MQRVQMSATEIADMDVVPNTGAVWSLIISAEYLNLRSEARGSFDEP
jgi:hypothetical protein